MGVGGKAALGFRDAYGEFLQEFEAAKKASEVPSRALLAWAGDEDLRKSMDLNDPVRRTVNNGVVTRYYANGDWDSRLLKAIDLETSDDDAKIVQAAAADGEPDGPQAVLLALREVSRVVAAQANTIRAMQARLDRLEGGAADKPAGAKPLTKARPGVIDGEAFLSKALAAQAAGRLSGIQIAIAEAHINNNMQPPADIVRAVMAEPPAGPGGEIMQ